MVSIIIPAYNAEKYIENCINSIVKQTYKDIEIIVIDDGSTDTTADIVKKKASECDYLRYYYQVNSGAAVARNNGIVHSNGEYIMFVDADDEIKENIIYELLDILKDSTIDIVACCCDVFDDKCIEEEHFFENDFEFNESNKEMLFEQLIDLNKHHPGKVTTAIGVPWGKLYRKNLLINNGIFFDEKLRRAQDNIFNMYSFNYASKIFYYNKCLYRYRRDHISAFRNTPYQLYQVLEARKVFFEKCPNRLSSDISILFQKEKMLYFFISLYRMFETNCSNDEVIKLINEDIYKDAIETENINRKWLPLIFLVKVKNITLLRFMFLLVIKMKHLKDKLKGEV